MSTVFSQQGLTQSPFKSSSHATSARQTYAWPQVTMIVVLLIGVSIWCEVAWTLVFRDSFCPKR